MDYKKDLKDLYQASAKAVVQVDVPPMNFLMVDGQGDPNTAPAYQEAVEALFRLSYALKFLVKKSPLQLDYGVMPLEGLWWTDDMREFSVHDKSNWMWTVMIMQPPCVMPGMVQSALVSLQKKWAEVAFGRVRLEAFAEGKCAQTLHVGPFAEEGPTIAKVHQFIQQRSGLRGKHHEIYLSDIRRAAPEKWKTIIRQPMQ